MLISVSLSPFTSHIPFPKYFLKPFSPCNCQCPSSHAHLKVFLFIQISLLLSWYTFQVPMHILKSFSLYERLGNYSTCTAFNHNIFLIWICIVKSWIYVWRHFLVLRNEFFVVFIKSYFVWHDDKWCSNMFGMIVLRQTSAIKKSTCLLWKSAFKNLGFTSAQISHLDIDR